MFKNKEKQKNNNKKTDKRQSFNYEIIPQRTAIFPDCFITVISVCIVNWVLVSSDYIRKSTYTQHVEQKRKLKEEKDLCLITPSKKDETETNYRKNTKGKIQENNC